MILTDVLTNPVLGPDGTRVGFVTDARFVLQRDADGSSEATLYGFVVSPRTRTSYLGYERTGIDSPALIARFLAWRHRGSFLVLWPDIARVIEGRIELRSGYRRYSPSLEQTQ